jgi:hypothetical protein
MRARPDRPAEPRFELWCFGGVLREGASGGCFAVAQDAIIDREHAGWYGSWCKTFKGLRRRARAMGGC